MPSTTAHVFTVSACRCANGPPTDSLITPSFRRINGSRLHLTSSFSTTCCFVLKTKDSFLPSLPNHQIYNYRGTRLHCADTTLLPSYVFSKITFSFLSWPAYPTKIVCSASTVSKTQGNNNNGPALKGFTPLSFNNLSSETTNKKKPVWRQATRGPRVGKLHKVTFVNALVFHSDRINKKIT